MRYLLKTDGIEFEVSKRPVPKTAPNGVQKVDASTGWPVWSIAGDGVHERGRRVRGDRGQRGLADGAGAAVAGAGRGGGPGDDPVVAEGPRW